MLMRKQSYPRQLEEDGDAYVHVQLSRGNHFRGHDISDETNNISSVFQFGHKTGAVSSQWTATGIRSSCEHDPVSVKVLFTFTIVVSPARCNWGAAIVLLSSCLSYEILTP